jgi:hypothetical protein
MARPVPSQLRELIARLFPELKTEQDIQGEAGHRQAAAVGAVLGLLESIPEELIHLSAEDSALYWGNAYALRSAWEDRNQSSNQVAVGRLPYRGHSFLFEIDRLLAKCPDEAPTAQTAGLEFILDVQLREVLRTDISSANSALINHEYKAATVLAGSVIEALLLWGLETYGEPRVRAAFASAPAKPLNEWALGPLTSAARACNLITDDTMKQAGLAQNFRNLIHPGRAARLQEKCDRGTVFGAPAGVERVAVDLVRAFPPPP